MSGAEHRRLPKAVAGDIAMLCRNDGFTCTAEDVQTVAVTGTHENEALASRVLNYIEQAIENGDI